MWSKGRVRNAPTTSSSWATDPRHLGLGDAGVGAERDHQIVDAAGRDAVDVGLHHHRIQGLVDPAAGFEDGREERALPQFRDPQLDVAGLGRQQLRAGAVAFGHPVLAAFVAVGADHARGFELDQLLQHGADRLADHVNAVAGAERVQQLRQGRLGQGHRWISFSVSLGRFTPKIPPMAAYITQPRRWTSNPTTTGDSPLTTESRRTRRI